MRRLGLIAGGCAAVVVLVLVLALSGGGGGGGELVSGSALAEAANTTARVQGASISSYGTVSTDTLADPLRLRMHGIQNTRQRAADLVGEYENFPNKGRVPFETIVVLPHLYMKSAIFSAGLPSGKSWLDIDLAKTGKQLGIGDPTQFSSGDPSQAVQALRAVSSRVERVGSDTVRGVATTHYKATVELSKLPAVTPPARRAEARQSVARLIQLIGTDSYPVEVWVDRRHLVRRMEIVMDMKIQGKQLKQDMTIEMYDFGPKQKIKPPPAGETYDASKLAGAAGSAAGP